MATPMHETKLKHVVIEIDGVEYQFSMSDLLGLKRVLEDLGIIKHEVPYYIPYTEPYKYEPNKYEYPTITWGEGTIACNG